ncbi:TRAP transporter small permease [Desulfococcus sp.]|uniref:TRAP transporter small permease n=1 Tax=Desulfococcus sp. TaxID=2025834 RepID=UPI0035930A74
MPPDKPVSRTDRLLNLLHRLEDGLLVGLLLAMILMAALQIVMRNLLGVSIPWGDMLVRIMVLWIGLLGAMIASRNGEHIRIDILSRLMPGRFQTRADAAVQLITAVLCAITAVHAFRFVRSEAEFGGMAFVRVPAWLCEAIIPVAFSVIALRYLVLSVRNFRQKQPPNTP